MTRIFEQQVRNRALHSLNYETAMCGGFITVADLQQFAAGWSHPAPEQVESLARRFHIPVPQGYGSAGKAA